MLTTEDINTLRVLAEDLAGTDNRGDAHLVTRAADEIERLRAKICAVERLTQIATIGGRDGDALRLQSIRAELGISANDPRITAE